MQLIICKGEHIFLLRMTSWNLEITNVLRLISFTIFHFKEFIDYFNGDIIFPLDVLGKIKTIIIDIQN